MPDSVPFPGVRRRFKPHLTEENPAHSGNPHPTARWAGHDVDGTASRSTPWASICLTPFELVGQATVPLMLLAFGMSLRRNGRPFRNGDTAGIVLAVALKTVAAPLVAVAIGSTVFGFGGKDLLAPVLCSALPTAQNVYVYSLRYPGSTALARDAVLLSLIVAVPVLVVFSAVFSNG